MSAIRRVGVCGAGGTMGSGIAIVSARAGFETVAYDLDADALAGARAGAERFFAQSVERGKLGEAERDAALAGLSETTRLEALAECDLVIEAVFEDLSTKRELFRRLDPICPEHTLFASNTSTLSISEIASGCGREDRVVGMHFCLPAQLMKLIEMSPGLNTSEASFRSAWEWTERAGQTPVRTQDTPGFILNAFVVPFNNDAIRAVEAGVAEPAEIDKAVKAALGYRMGPLELLDMVGLDTQVRLCEAFHPVTLDPRAAAPPLLRRMVAAGRLGRKSGRGFRAGEEDAPPGGEAEAYEIVSAGPSRSFPEGDAFPARSTPGAGVAVYLGAPHVPDPKRRAILIELGTECLGAHTGEGYGEEGSNVLGFARYRNGDDPPSDLVELVRQPASDPRAIDAARAAFEGAGLQVAVCADQAGRIGDRLVRPKYNDALRFLDEGRAAAKDIDLTCRLGLSYPDGPVERIERGGLAHHHDVTQALFEVYGTPGYAPARRARVARQRASGG
ncbi:MAG: hypothetical protein J4G09_05860 [Proteobacteria bacterium]|nr:hypothetical protein [Pseudomonadota bacterium]